MDEPADFCYRAFLSYRSADRKQAERLHRRLEAYRTPRALVGRRGEKGPIPSRLGVIFRDRDEARSAEDVETALAKALAQSESLIVLCSPETAKPGGWVDKEISLFRELRPEGAILAVIGWGEPPDIFPAALRPVGPQGGLRLPLAADLRPASRGGDGETRACVKLVAGMLGIGFDELWRRDRRRAAQRALVATAAAFLLTLAVATISLLLWHEAKLQKSAALSQHAEKAIREGDYATAELIALEALPGAGLESWKPFLPEAAAALYAAWLNNRERQIFQHAGSVEAIVASRMAGLMASGANEDTLQVWNANPPRKVRSGNFGERFLKQLAFSPDGQRLLAVALSGASRLIDVTNGAFVNFKWPVEVVARFSPDGTHIIAVSPGEGATIFDLTGAVAASNPMRRPHSAAILSEPSPDGTRVLSQDLQFIERKSQYPVLLWSLADAAPVELALDEGNVKFVRWSARSDMAVLVQQNGNVTLLDLRSRAPALRQLRAGALEAADAAFAPDGHSLLIAIGPAPELWDLASFSSTKLEPLGSRIHAVIFSPDGGRAAATSFEGSLVRVWDFSGRQTSPIDLNLAVGSVKSAAFSPDGEALWTGSYDGSVRVWDLGPDPVRAPPLEGSCGEIRQASASDDGGAVATLSDQAICLWTSLAERPSARVLERDHHYGDSIALSPDGRYVAVAGLDDRARLWDSQAPANPPRDLLGHAGAVRSVRFSRDSRHLVTASDDGTARIWSLATSGAAPAVFGQAGGPGFNDAAFSPDGRKIAAGADDGVAYVWTLDRKDSALALRGHRKSLNSVEFDASGRRVATASDDGEARIWDLDGDPGRPVVLHVDENRVTAARFSPDGARVLTVSDATATFVWTVAGEKLATLEGHENATWSAAWSRDGRWIATTSADATARIWPLVSSRPAAYALRGHRGPVTSAIFAPDLRWILTTSSDATVRKWPFFPDSDRLKALARSSLGRCLSVSQRQDLGLPAAAAPGENPHSARSPSSSGSCE